MKKRTKYVHEGKYVAAVDVELNESDDDWTPYLSVEDACKLDDVRELSRAGRIQAAAKKAKDLPAYSHRTVPVTPNPSFERARLKRRAAQPRR